MASRRYRGKSSADHSDDRGTAFLRDAQLESVRSDVDALREYERELWIETLERVGKLEDHHHMEIERAFFERMAYIREDQARLSERSLWQTGVIIVLVVLLLLVLVVVVGG